MVVGNNRGSRDHKPTEFRLNGRIKASLKLRFFISKGGNDKLGEIKPCAHEGRGEIKFKSNVQNPKLVFQVSWTANCWEYVRISDLKIDFPYQILSFNVPKLPSFQQVAPKPVSLLAFNSTAQTQLL